MSKAQQPKLVVLSKSPEEEDRPEVDPLEEQILNMRLTANLMKEVKFDATSNKFDYLETLLSEENSKFNQKGKNAVETQKGLIKKMKTLLKVTREVKDQSSSLNYPKLHVELEQLRSLKQEVEKYNKLSQGMIKYLQKIDEKLSKE